MHDPWMALIDLSPQRREQVQAVLAAAGIGGAASGWEPPAGPAPAALVASLTDYTQNQSRCPWLHGTDPAPRVMLLAPSAPTGETLRVQLDYDLLNVVPEILCENAWWMERLVRGLVYPEEMFDIRRYVEAPELVEQFPVSTLAEKHQLADEVATRVRPYVAIERQIRDVHLMINELINNAFFHSFRNPEGEEKYSPRAFSRLDEADRVVLEVAAAEGTVAVAVEDNRGTLSPRQVLRYMLRQTSGDGVFDSHGRGFYLMSNLTDHLSICLTPAQRTRIVCLVRAGVDSPAHTLHFFVTPTAAG